MNPTERVIKHCTDRWRLVFFWDELKDFNSKGIIHTAKGMVEGLDEFEDINEDDVDWNKVEDVIMEYIYQL